MIRSIAISPVLGGWRTARCGLVGDEVALAEDNEPAIDSRNRLDDMGVLTDDSGDQAGAGEAPPDGARRLIGVSAWQRPMSALRTIGRTKRSILRKS